MIITVKNMDGPSSRNIARSDMISLKKALDKMTPEESEKYRTSKRVDFNPDTGEFYYYKES